MGDKVTHVPYPITIPKTLIMFLRIVDLIAYTLSAFLHHLGLYPSFSTSVPTPWDWNDNLRSHCISNDGVNTVSSSHLKRRLPVLKFASKKIGSKFKEEEEDEEAAMCGVCLVGLRERDEVRVLGNCQHVFHRECIDQWMDRGKLTCPMCRSHLLPPPKVILPNCPSIDALRCVSFSSG